jgi:hypothetical protein
VISFIASKSEPCLLLTAPTTKQEKVTIPVLFRYFLLSFTPSISFFLAFCSLHCPGLGKSVIIASQIFKDCKPHTEKVFHCEPEKARTSLHTRSRLLTHCWSRQRVDRRSRILKWIRRSNPSRIRP